MNWFGVIIMYIWVLSNVFWLKLSAFICKIKHMQNSPFVLSSSLKQYTLDQDKALDPKSTVKNALESLKNAFDLSNVNIVQRDDKVEGAYSFSSVSDQMQTSGKGLTFDQARASAIMEFVERYSWMHFDYKNYAGYTMASYNEIKKTGVPTVDESYFMSNLLSMPQAEKRKWTEEIKNIPLKWIKGVSLLTKEQYYYPINWHNKVLSTNGLSAGNSMEEAILQAICEVVERENVVKYIFEKKLPNEVAQHSIGHPILLNTLNNAKKAGITFELKDISFDLGIPAFMVVGTSQKDRGSFIYRGVGQGAHTSPEKALIRSLAEYFESYSLMSAARKDTNLDRWIKNIGKGHFGFYVTLNKEMLEKRKKYVKLKDVSDLSNNDIKKEIETCLSILKKFKYDVILINKTHPKLNIPVVRVLIPGMRNIINVKYNINALLSEVYCEAGNEAEGLRHLKEFIKVDPLAKEFCKDLEQKGAAGKYMKTDYQEILFINHAFKKDAIKNLKDFNLVISFFERPEDYIK